MLIGLARDWQNSLQHPAHARRQIGDRLDCSGLVQGWNQCLLTASNPHPLSILICRTGPQPECRALRHLVIQLGGTPATFAWRVPKPSIG